MEGAGLRVPAPVDQREAIHRVQRHDLAGQEDDRRKQGGLRIGGVDELNAVFATGDHEAVRACLAASGDEGTSPESIRES
ncbi:MAG: hypothetical protein RL385_6035 [Pseudomonadota bacterium]